MRPSLSLSQYLLFCALLIPFIGVRSQFHQIDTFLQHQIANYRIPALSVALIENGKLIFQLASATKLLSATAFMTLVQEGKLNLDDKVKNYLPELPGTWDDMRISDLLAHQSGIVDLLGLKLDFKNDKEAIDTAIARPLDFAPGTKTVYAGGDFAVVMQLIEKISGIATGHSGGPALSDIVRLPERKLTAIVLTNQLELRPFLIMQVVRLYLDHKKHESCQVK